MSDGRAAPGRELAWLWASVALALLALSRFAGRIALLAIPCPLKQLSGLPCLGCGTLRCAIALSELDLPAAFALNPLAAIGWLFLIAGGLAAPLAALLGLASWEPPRRLAAPARFAAAAALAANWLYLVAAGR